MFMEFCGFELLSQLSIVFNALRVEQICQPFLGKYMLSAASILSTLSTGVDAGKDAKKHRSMERCCIRFW